METEAEIICPWCGEAFVTPVDATAGTQEWITDCEVCCRPILARIVCEDGEILSLDAREG